MRPRSRSTGATHGEEVTLGPTALPLRRLGRSDLEVSPIALGCMGFGSSAWRPWTLDPPAALPLLHRALEHGINFLDTANVYSTGRSEELVGGFLRQLGAAARARLVVATKLFYPVGVGETGLSAGNVRQSCDDSLRRLGLERIDLLQIHRWDSGTAVEETMAALAGLVRAGKVRALGASNIRAWQLAKMNFTARAHGWPEFVSVQAHYNLLHREDERELLPFCLDQQIGVLPWSPLARGRLARAALPLTPLGEAATARAGSDDVIDTLYGPPTDPLLGVVARLAGELDSTPARVAIAWLAGRPGVTAPVVGITRAAHIDDAIAALDLELPPEALRDLDAAYTPRAYVDLPWTSRNQTVLPASS